MLLLPFVFQAPCIHIHTFYTGVFCWFIVPELSLVTANLHLHIWCPYFPSCPFLKLSSSGWPAWWQRCCCPIWSGRSSSPQQSFIFKKGVVDVKASFPPKTPSLARSLQRNINLFSFFPDSTQMVPLLQVAYCILLPSPNSSILLQVCDVPGKPLEERPYPAEQHHPTVAISCTLS